MDKVGLSGKYQTYPEYKDSGVEWLGSVPMHWIPVRFKHRFSEKKKASNPMLDAGSISFGRVIYKSSENLAPETKASYQEVLEGEFLINPLNMNYDLLSLRTALSEINVVVSTGYIVIRSDERLHKRYVRWLLQEFDVAHMKTLGSGVRQTINYMDIGNSFFYEPAKIEQQKIASFLDHETAKIDTLIEKQQQLIKLLKEKRQAVISHAVTKGLNPNAPMRDSGVEWLGEVPEHWDSLPMKLVVRTRKGVAFKSLDFCDSGIRVVKASDIKQKTIRATDVFLPVEFAQEYSKAILNSGDIILSTVGSNPDVKNSAVGQIGMVPMSLCGTLLNQNTVIFDPDENKVLREYLFYILQMEGYRDHLDLHAHGTANQSSLSINDMLDFDICFPSIKEQHYICETLASSQRKLSDIEKKAVESETLLKERRTALISAAVTGKIDVRDWVAPESSNNTMDSHLRGNDAELNAAVDLNTEADLSKEAGL